VSSIAAGTPLLRLGRSRWSAKQQGRPRGNSWGNKAIAKTTISTKELTKVAKGERWITVSKCSVIPASEQ
jgi:hypothetical protein